MCPPIRSLDEMVPKYITVFKTYGANAGACLPPMLVGVLDGLMMFGGVVLTLISELHCCCLDEVGEIQGN